MPSLQPPPLSPLAHYRSSSSISSTGIGPTSPTLSRLPADEHAFLLNRKHLSDLYEKRAFKCEPSPLSPVPPAETTTTVPLAHVNIHKPYSGLAKENRVCISAIKYATRKALGGGFDPLDAEISFRNDGSENYRPLDPELDDYGLEPIYSNKMLPENHSSPYTPPSDHSGSASSLIPTPYSPKPPTPSSDQLSHAKQYIDRFGPDAEYPARLPAYRETRSGEPMRTFGIAFEPVKSCFDWSEDESEDTAGEMENGNLPQRRESRKLQRRSRREQ